MSNGIKISLKGRLIMLKYRFINWWDDVDDRGSPAPKGLDEIAVVFECDRVDLKKVRWDRQLKILAVGEFDLAVGSAKREGR